MTTAIDWTKVFPVGTRLKLKAFNGLVVRVSEVYRDEQGTVQVVVQKDDTGQDFARESALTLAACVAERLN